MLSKDHRIVFQNGRIEILTADKDHTADGARTRKNISDNGRSKWNIGITDITQAIFISIDLGWVWNRGAKIVIVSYPITVRIRIQGICNPAIKTHTKFLAVSKAVVVIVIIKCITDAIIVGMGVNLAAAPDLPDRKTASLADYGPAPDRDMFAHSLAAAFARELDRWRTYGLEPLARRWESVAHPLGTPLVVQPPGEERIEGAFGGLTPDGALSLRLADGSTRVIHAGDVMLQNEEN